MHLRQTRFGYEKGHFNKVTNVASNLVGRMKTTGGHEAGRGALPLCLVGRAALHHPRTRRTRVRGGLDVGTPGSMILQRRDAFDAREHRWIRVV